VVGKSIVRGAAAGALGTVAIDVATYADMLARGRPPNEVPARAAAQLARGLHLPLGTGDRGHNRADALGALFGYAAGTAIGALSGLVAERHKAPLVPFAVAVGAAAELATAVPSIALGVADPRRWSVEDWLAELLPHLVYGGVTVLALYALEREAAAARRLPLLVRWRRGVRAALNAACSGGASRRVRAARAPHARGSDPR
jgi:hypothetical protein